MTAIRGLSRRCYSASRRRVGTSMRMKPAATIAAFKFSVSAKSGGTEEREEGGSLRPPYCCRRSSSPARRRRQLSKRVTLGSGNYSDNESAWGPQRRAPLCAQR